MNQIAIYKWKLAWCCFAILIAVFCVVMYHHYDKTWFGNFVSAFGVLLTLYPTLIIFVQSRADSEKSTRNQLDHLQKLSQQELEKSEQLNQKHIDKLDASTKEQIAEFKKTTAEQIKAIEENTNRQIENYIKQTTEIVAKLNDNSVLLAEILLRQLEEKLGELNTQLNNAYAQYKDLQGFKFLRTNQEREEQLNRQRSFINRVEQAITYVRNKLQQVKAFLGGE